MYMYLYLLLGEKPFKCTYCEYATAQNSTLKIHLKRHHAPERAGNKRRAQIKQSPSKDETRAENVATKPEGAPDEQEGETSSNQQNTPSVT